jgi:MFS family permease
MEITKSNPFRRPDILLLLMSVAVPLSFAAWRTLLNNFAIEQAAFTGREMGILQSLREIPGFLAFGVVFLLLIMREQRLALVSLSLLGIGTALTGFFPSILGLYVTTVVMSLGFHYYETLQTSLTMQWIDKSRSAETFGRLIAVGSFASIITFALIWLADDLLQLDYRWIYLLMGGLTVLIALFAWLAFPDFPQKTEQHKHMVLRSRYWLYYALTFMSGARRQIFVVFAGFLMVEKFGYSVSQIALLFLLNATLNTFLAPRIG